MSRTFTTTVACPGCGASLDLEGYESVNADRQPELREQILEGTLQVYSCACGESFRGAPELSYMDLGRKQWIAVHSLSALERYREAEDHAQEVFDTSLGKLAPPTAQELGQGIRPRVVFGWGALREKLVARDADVEDDALELLKLQVFKSQGIMPGPGQALRLVEADVEERLGQQRAPRRPRKRRRPKLGLRGRQRPRPRRRQHTRRRRSRQSCVTPNKGSRCVG